MAREKSRLRRRIAVRAAWVLRRFDVGAAIDRGFRYLEMLIITALVSVPIGIIWPVIGIILKTVFSIAAGVYLCHPLANYLLRALEHKVRVQDRVNATIRSHDAVGSHLLKLLMFVSAGVASLGLTGFIIPVIEATIQLDENRIRQYYQQRRQWNAHCSSLRAKGEWEDGCPIPMPPL